MKAILPICYSKLDYFTSFLLKTLGIDLPRDTVKRDVPMIDTFFLVSFLMDRYYHLPHWWVIVSMLDQSHMLHKQTPVSERTLYTFIAFNISGMKSSSSENLCATQSLSGYCVHPKRTKKTYMFWNVNK